ncbi:DUF680 domain-containing protein [Mesorhizobium sp. ESP-6-4]|uniref:DUF680 domain-containing protein n=1 Tax=unclassified Mesorhizobium TaxID=325217 RepID=UPI000BAF2FF4|nr:MULTISPECIES: DUF680 domain-containing protein [unclassified Mesorhizobium]MBZ9661054.1 DUF680 domain-containing protein [Mesorhizobium sp. ESP-6-4]MBZ9816642.1 DUF680 domain-containing protein [Mesorhizobium sp. CA7]MBZ9840885.1 DUF680 domain-containing protein [Mesorhizobium sp. CA5]MBZ9861571.1 DUF680 domain-containing protein [Mesorhizobium sp. CA12]MBZ9867751.1 DUF680 domain-containing protein [Mesorhizobium sp. CA15]
MTKIALTAVALLVATGAAFASSDNYGAANAKQPAVTIDRTVTTSIAKSDADVRRPVVQGTDHNLFGNH